MLKSKKKLTKTKMQHYLIIALCSISDCLYRELIDNSPYSLSSWKRIGISKAALDKLRDLIKEHGKCLEAMHKSVKSEICPDPPCLNEGWLESICRAALKS
jgi:hypothetical protein